MAPIEAQKSYAGRSSEMQGHVDSSIEGLRRKVGEVASHKVMAAGPVDARSICCGSEVGLFG